MREFAKLGLTRSVGGVLGLALARELTPVVTSIILAGNTQYISLWDSHISSSGIICIQDFDAFFADEGSI